MSTPLGSVHTMRVSCCFWYPSSREIFVSRSVLCGSSSDCTNMRASSFCCYFLSAHSTITHWRLALKSAMGHTHAEDLAGAEASAAVVPVVVLELVDLDALPIIELRSSKCHHRRQDAHCLAPARANCLWAKAGTAPSAAETGCGVEYHLTLCTDGTADRCRCTVSVAKAPLCWTLKNANRGLLFVTSKLSQLASVTPLDVTRRASDDGSSLRRLIRRNCDL